MGIGIGGMKMSKTYDPLAAAAQAAAEGPNHNEVETGGGGYTPPVAGKNVGLRFVEYLELGLREEEYQGVKKKREKVRLTFELVGPKYPVSENGVAQRISFVVTLSLNEKAKFYKLFRRMNYAGNVTHMAQLLGADFIGDIAHVTKGEGTEARTYANLFNEDGYTIRAPFIDVVDPETDETSQKRKAVGPAVSPIKLFLWNFATKDMWDDLYIDGKYDDQVKDGKVVREGTSKNRIQNEIKQALNWSTSPMIGLLGGEPDIGEAEKPVRTEKDKQAAAEAKTGAKGDPLADVA